MESKLLQRIKAKIRLVLGVTALEEKYESLYFLLNNVIDITQLPKTRNKNLRQLQQCDTVLLAIFDKLCRKYGLTYWLDGGTLLGAYRHKGFIPWDDDSDVTMPREEMNRVIPLMKNDAEGYGLTISTASLHPLRCLIISYQKEKTGVWLDIFPLDHYITDDSKETVSQKVYQYYQFFWKNLNKSAEYLTAKKKDIFSSSKYGEYHYLLGALEQWVGQTKTYIYEEKIIFPIKRIQFEGFEFNVPNDTNAYLTSLYDKDYMKFPRNAINTHGAADSPAYRAKANGIDMDEVYQQLMDIYNKITVD